MAVRTISTKLAVEGEAQYKQKIASCNTELKTLKSSLALVESEFKNNANSMAALTAKGAALASVQEAQAKKVKELEAALENARAAQSKYAERVSEAEANVSKYEQALADLKDSTGDTSEEQAALTEELKKWQSELEDATAGQAAAERGVQNWQQQLNRAKIEANDLTEAIDKNNKYLAEAENAADGCATSIDEYGKEVKDAGEESEDFGDKSKSAINTLSKVLAAAGVAATIKEIAEAIKACVDASVEFESAIAGVYKTVDGTDEQLAAISDGIKQMSTELPASTTEIAAVAEAAGQLGIKTEDVLSFTRTMIDLGESTNLSAEEAASALAKFANITGTAAGDYGRLGSTIVDLGNNFATTEADIVAMSTRLASAGTLAGMSEAEIMALAAAMSSVGIEAEAGGTAMTQTFSAIETAVSEGGDGLDQFAKIAGTSSTEFATMWETNAVGAVQLFIAGLGELDAQGESATLVLDEMGLSGVRQSNMLKSLGLASDQLTKAVEYSNAAWMKNAALTEEAGKRYETTESRLAMCKNATTNFQAAIGDALTPALGELADAGTAGFSWAAEFIEENPWLVQALTGAVGAVLILGGALTTYTAITTAAKAIQDALNLSMTLCPAVAVAAAIGALVVVVGSWIASVGSADEETKAFTESLTETKTAYEELSATMETEQATTAATAASLADLLEVEEKSALQKDLIKQKVDELNEAVPELGLAYDAEKDSLEGLTAAELESMVERAAAREEYEAQVARLNELDVERAEIEARLTEARLALNEAEETGVGNTRELQNNIDELTAAQEENAAQIAELTEVSRDYAEQQAASKAATAEMKSGVQGLISEMEKLQTAYDEAYTKAVESIDGQVGLFNELDGSAKTSIDNLIATLEGQVSYMDTYAANIQKAMELGVDEGLIKKLSDGSEESAQILAAIVQGGEEDIKALNEQLAKVEEGKTDFAETVAEMETDFSDKMAGIEKRVQEAVDELDVSIEAGAAGAATIEGYIEGAEGMRSSLVSTYKSLARAANNAYKSELDIHSPSRVFREDGKNTIRGAIEGAEEEKGHLAATYEDIAKTALDSMRKSLPSNIEEPSSSAARRAQTAAIVDAVSSKSGGEGPVYQFHVDHMEVREEGAAERIAQELYYMTEREKRSRGGGSL